MKLDISLGLLVLEKLYLLAGLRGMPLCLTSKICFGLNRSHWGGIAPTIFMLHICLKLFSNSTLEFCKFSFIRKLIVVISFSAFLGVRFSPSPFAKHYLFFNISNILVYWWFILFLQAPHSDLLKLLIILLLINLVLYLGIF